MKITFVIPGRTGGGTRVLALYADGLLHRGHDVRILYPAPPTNPREILRNSYLWARYRSRIFWLRPNGTTVRTYTTLTPEIVGQNDLVIAGSTDCVLAIADLPGLCGIKVNNCHGRELHNMERTLKSWRLSMPRIVVSSHLEQAMREYGSRDDIYIVHNGVDQTEYFPCLPDEQRNAVGTVYHAAYTKNPDLMLAVFWQLHRRSPSTRLLMFGSFPRPAGLPPETTYVRLPTLAGARRLYSQSQVWFCASRHEGFGMPLLEAMACGCAVVSTDCGGTRDLVEDDVNGFLVSVADAEEMTERILQLLKEPALRRRMAAASRAKLAEFTWQRTITAFESALVDIMAKAEMRV